MRSDSDRRAYLDRVCGQDPDLRGEVEALLAATEDMPDGFLEPPGSQPAVDGELAVASRIASYEILGPLGAGGMGEVYLARDLRLDRKIALKLLPSKSASDRERLQRFEQEARALAALNHPNIITIHSVEEAGGRHFLTTELVEGKTLGERIPKGGLRLARFLGLARALAGALAAAHQRGIIHRDLKPANIMVSDEDRLKVLDFGLAKRWAALGAEPRDDQVPTGEGRLLGTVPYMSPEQVKGKAIDPRSDVFSLGVVFYQMATGIAPFQGETLADLVSSILKDAPRPVTELSTELRPQVWRVIRRCLEKDPERRYLSAREVVAELEAADDGAPRGPEPTPARLRRWWPPQLPDEPYPVLLPYRHPALLEGRAAETATLRRLLRMPAPILGFYGGSGAGKSSLLAAGLVPALRAEGQPVALVRRPQEPDLAGRLLGDLLEDAADPTFSGGDGLGPEVRGFIDRLLEVRRLTGRPPLLVIDQLEDLLRPQGGPPAPTSAAGRRPLSTFGILLAASALPRPALDGPTCRWLLTYRQEFHGELVTWLRDVLHDVPAERLASLRGLPSDLSGDQHWHCMVCPPLGAPAAGGRRPGTDPVSETARVFQAAIEAPLALTDAGGAPRYRYRFGGDGAARLARAFAMARAARPDAALTPELQVVLAHLLAGAEATDGEAVIEVPEDPGRLIDEALEDHLRRALDAAFPAGRKGARAADARTGRARALLALCELAGHAGERRREGLPADELGRAIGDGGEEILEKLATAQTRLVVLRQSAGGWRYVLSHDRMAEVVVRAVERRGGHGRLKVDAELVGLRRLVALESTLFASEGKAPRLARRHYSKIADHASVLLWDEKRRAWWAACRRQRHADRRQLAAWWAAAATLMLVVGLVMAGQARQRAEHRSLLERVAEGEPEVALQALVRLTAEPQADGETLRAVLRRRQVPSDVLERGLGGLGEEERGAAVLAVVELALPMVEETPEDPVLIANLVWALDFAPGRDPSLAAPALALRDRVLEPLRRLRPPPAPPGRDDPDWVTIPAGRFPMGSGPGEGGHSERPRHEVSVSAFRILRHEVSGAEYRRLVPGHRASAPEGGDQLPAPFLSWYAAYAYAAWLGGRLPTEAEWEYAARAGCAYSYCTGEGLEATLDAVAWTLRNSQGRKAGEVSPRPVMRLEPNPWGLYDMLGSVWEWTADWFGPYAPAAQRDPWGRAAPQSVGRRVNRGGSYGSGASSSQVTSRLGLAPAFAYQSQGARPVLPLGPNLTAAREAESHADR